MFPKEISFWTANKVSGRRVVSSHKIRPDLSLLNSEKNKGDAGKLASSFAQNIFRNKNVYSSPGSSKWELYKSNAVSEKCFAKKLLCKILGSKVAMVEILKRYLWRSKTKIPLRYLIRYLCVSNVVVFQKKDCYATATNHTSTF